MLKPGHVVALSVLGLLCLGVVMVNSSLMDVGRPVSIQSVLTSRSSVYAVLAVLAMILTARLPLLRLAPGVNNPVATGPIDDRWGGWTLKPLWIGAGLVICCLLLVYIPGFGRHVNGANRWLNVPIPGMRELSVQPSEIAKWAMIGLVAWYCWRIGSGQGGRERISDLWKGVVPGLAAVAIVCAVIVKEDLGTAVLIVLVAATMFMAAGAKIWHFAAAIPVGALAFVAAVITSPYRLERITSFINPYLYPQGKGYHMIQSMVAVSSGEGFGRGLGNGLNKFGYLPETETDFIFANICEEMGIPGALLVAVLYGAIVWAGLSIVSRQKPLILKLIGLGVVSTVGLQAVINMAVVTGMAPTKGIALPLLSSGGTGWILTAASLGLLINMDRIASTFAASTGTESTAEQPQETTANTTDRADRAMAAGACEPLSV
ncbi:MAG: putative peptidoglycan glycosyltransferase FtsW [Phycisphaerales bacterium]|nr:putative peptidoglycan glycosyltransferase FtsW [Phycisphaerales bacterium]